MAKKKMTMMLKKEKKKKSRTDIYIYIYIYNVFVALTTVELFLTSPSQTNPPSFDAAACEGDDDEAPLLDEAALAWACS